MSIIVFIIVLSILIVVHEFGHFITAKRCGVRVEMFSIGFGPKLFGIKRGDTEYKISAIPLGGYVKMAGESYSDKPKGKPWEFLSRPVGERFKIIISGVVLNYILGFIIFSLVFMIGFPIPKNTNRIGSLIRGYPAVRNGLKRNDTIIAVNDKRTKTWEELTGQIHQATEGPIDLTIKRDRETINVTLVPKVEKKFFYGGKKIALIGIRPEHDVKRYGFIKSIQLSGEKLIKVTSLTFRLIGWMITGKLSLKQVSGPIGIFVMTGDMANLGFVYLLDFVGLISVSLAIFNILPIPVLDGGHLVFLGIEKLKGRPLSAKTQETVTQVGFILLMALLLFVSYNDVIKFGVIDKLLGLFK